MEICDRTFQLVEDHLAALNHTGPVGLSCNDTKLFSSLWLFWDKENNAYFLVGGVDCPYRVADPDSVRQVISEGKIKKAMKVCRYRYYYNLSDPLMMSCIGSPLVFDCSIPKCHTYYRGSDTYC
jgi:hypothetical protein